MVVLADLSGLEAYADQVASRVREKGSALVVGLPGTGRSTLVNLLPQALEGAHVLHLPLEDLDAPTQVLGQAASPLEADLRRRALRDDVPLEKRAAEVAKDLAERDAVLVVPVPASWRLDDTDQASRPEAFEARRRVRCILHGFLKQEKLRLVLVQETRFPDDELNPGPRFGEAIRLPWAPVLWEALEDAEGWRDLAEAARRVLAMKGEVEDLEAGRPSPIALRLAVGAVWLGRSPADVKSALRRTDAVDVLASTLAEMLKRRASGDGSDRRLLSAATLAARGRLPLPSAGAVEAAGMAPGRGDVPFLTEALCYGGALLRMSDTVRSVFLKGVAAAPKAGEPQHAALADLYASLDGVTDLAVTSPEGAPYWLERLHQAAHAGSLRQEEWSRMLEATGALPREMVWDRAKALSLSGRYREAADLFDGCRRRDEKDAYSWHYFGYNLLRAGEGLAAARPAFEKAVELEAWNPRWNERLVSLLIRQALPDAAERAWERALKSIPDRYRGEWLARHLHGNVARKWLRHGFPDRAEQVLGRVEESILDNDPELFDLRQQIQDALEAMELREGVYPPDYPWKERWKDPGPLVPDRLPSGKERLAWHPARVVGRTPSAVEVVFADFDPERPPREIPKTWRRDLSGVELFTRALPADDWERAGGGSAAVAGGFWFIGVYEGEEVLLVPAEGPAAARQRPRYWKRWNRRPAISTR